MPGNHERPHQPERDNTEEAFDAIINQETWDPEARILNAPTAIDELPGAFDSSFTPDDLARSKAFDARLDDLFNQIETEERAERGRADPGGRGRRVMAEIAGIAYDAEQGEDLGTYQFGGRLPGMHEIRFGMAQIMREFPNPAALVERYDQLMELHKAQNPGATLDIEDKKTAMERVAALMYGERWGVYQETLREEAEAAKAEEEPLVAAETEAGQAVAEANPPTVETEPQDLERPQHELQAHEVLSGFQMYRTDVREGAANFITGVQHRVAQTKNLLSTPKNAYLQLRRDRMEEKYNRIAVKQDASGSDLWNRFRGWRAEKAYDKLQKREAALHGHNNIMRGRLDQVDNKGGERRQIVAEYRKQLMEKRVEAQERKLLREARRAHRRELLKDKSLSHGERERRVNSPITPEDKKRIRQVAIAAVRRETKNKGIE